MVLGFDMADPIVDPNGNVGQRVNDWKSFFDTWNDNKPVFVARYFGRRKHNWVVGEIPKNLRSLVPEKFNNFQYIAALTPTGKKSTITTVNNQGVVNGPGEQADFIYYQHGLTEDGTSGLTQRSIINYAKIEAIATCKSMASVLEIEWDEEKGPVGDFMLSESGKIFVFLDVEPQTKLHPLYWKTWADTVRAFTIYIGPIFPGRIALQPFLPCLYCSMYSDRPKLRAIQDIFNNRDVPQCHAIMSSVWSEVYRTDGLIPQEQAKILMPPFGKILHSPETGFPDAQVVIWQYFINHAHNSRFSIDFSLTTDITYAGRPITDYMLKINYDE